MTAKTPTEPLVFGSEQLDALTAAARASPRRRRNLNLHATASDPAQRLLNAVEPGSYVQPHRHLESNKDETLVVLRGAFGLVLFDEHGVVTRTAIIRAHGDRIGAHIPRGVFHTLLSLEPGSVFFEAKAGPYDPQADKEGAPWAPAEGDEKAPLYHARLTALFAPQHRSR